MEALGAAASIIAVLELSGKVLSHIRSAKGATKERKRLRDEVQACDDILQQLQDDAEDSDEATAWSKKIAALEKPGGPLSRLLVTMTMIKDRLEDCSKSGDRSRKIAASLKWPFVAKEVDELLVALEREKTLLGLALTIDTQKLLHKIEETSVKNSQYLKELLQSLENTSISQDGHLLQLEIGVDTIIRIQETKEEHDNNRTILDWLSPLDFTSQQNDFIRRRQADTGLWLLQSKEYQHWVTTAKETLFCPGMPGAGKTVLTSIVIEDLYERYKSQSNVGIAYIYCNFRRQETQTIEDLFSSLLKQLVGCKSSIPKEVQDLFHRHQRSQSRPSLQEILATLKSVLGGFSRSFIIVDALDECQDYDSCRSRLIQQISSIQTETALNFFTTSRNIPEIVEKFAGAWKIEIRASVADIGRYLIGKMPRLPRCVQRSNDLQDEIVTNITKSADGMFLLAQLHMDSLVDTTTIRSVRTALQRLGKGSDAYGSAYDDAMERITGQSEARKELALRVLMWITCAKWQLTIHALQHALAVQIDESSLDEDDFVDINDIISVCAGLVTIDEQNNIVSLVHYTTQEYFQKQEIQEKWFPAAQDAIFIVCTTYLGFKDFKEGPCEERSDYEKRLEKHPFYRYAACNWTRHLSPGSVDWNSVAFLKSERMIGSSVQVADIYQQSQRYPRLWIRFTRREAALYKNLTVLHLAAYSGINELVSLLDASHIHRVDCRRRTPLRLAAEEGHVKTVQLLLAKGAHINATDSDRQSPLGIAAKTGHMEIVRLLLDVGADPNLDQGRTPLGWTIVHDHPELVRMLIDHKANIEKMDDGYNSPLVLAATCRQGLSLEPLQILLESGADIEARDRFGQTALMRAVHIGSAETVRLLLDYGANIYAEDKERQSPLSVTQEPDYDKAEIARIIFERHKLLSSG